MVPKENGLVSDLVSSVLVPKENGAGGGVFASGFSLGVDLVRTGSLNDPVAVITDEDGAKANGAGVAGITAGVGGSGAGFGGDCCGICGS